MATFLRIQPIGQPLRASKDMDGRPLDPPGMFVFRNQREMQEATGLWRARDLDPSKVEIVEIAYSGPTWEHPIEGGTLIDPKRARIMRRVELTKGLGKTAARSLWAGMAHRLAVRYVRAQTRRRGQP